MIRLVVEICKCIRRVPHLFSTTTITDTIEDLTVDKTACQRAYSSVKAAGDLFTRLWMTDDSMHSMSFVVVTVAGETATIAPLSSFTHSATTVDLSIEKLLPFQREGWSYPSSRRPPHLPTVSSRQVLSTDRAVNSVASAGYEPVLSRSLRFAARWNSCFCQAEWATGASRLVYYPGRRYCAVVGAGSRDCGALGGERPSTCVGDVLTRGLIFVRPRRTLIHNSFEYSSTHWRRA